MKRFKQFLLEDTTATFPGDDNFDGKGKKKPKTPKIKPSRLSSEFVSFPEGMTPQEMYDFVMQNKEKFYKSPNPNHREFINNLDAVTFKYMDYPENILQDLVNTTVERFVDKEKQKILNATRAGRGPMMRETYPFALNPRETVLFNVLSGNLRKERYPFHHDTGSKGPKVSVPTRLPEQLPGSRIIDTSQSMPPRKMTPTREFEGVLSNKIAKQETLRQALGKVDSLLAQMKNMYGKDLKKAYDTGVFDKALGSKIDYASEQVPMNPPLEPKPEIYNIKSERQKYPEFPKQSKISQVADVVTPAVDILTPVDTAITRTAARLNPTLGQVAGMWTMTSLFDKEANAPMAYDPNMEAMAKEGNVRRMQSFLGRGYNPEARTSRQRTQ